MRRPVGLRLLAGLAITAVAGTVGVALAIPQASAATGSATGFATRNGGTTGGAGGQTVRVSSGTGIHSALCNRSSSSTPIIIEVQGTINHGNTSKVSGDSCNTADDVIELKQISNVSIIGVGSGAVFDQLGIHIREASNIIIQNVTVRNVKKSGSPTSNGGDAIGMESDVRNVWVDHVTLEASGGESEGYDGLFDMKNNTQYVTLSYSILRNSGRGGLIGSSESDRSNGYVTFHHNVYENIDSRTPLLRGGIAHIYNNHYTDIEKSGINSRAGGRAKVENNYFQDSNDVLGTFYTSEAGYWQVSGNIYDNIDWSSRSGDNQPAGPNPTSNTSVSIPYSYTLDGASCVPNMLRQISGANKGNRVSDGSCSPTSPPPSNPPSPTPTVPPTPGPDGRYEAEYSPASCDGEIESEHSGYSGSGYCNTENASGAASQFLVSSSGGTTNLTIRHANGGSGNRPANLVVNGSTVQQGVAFNPTGGWTSYSNVSVSVALNSGTNTIRLVATTGEGLSNIDYLQVSGGTGPSPTPSPTAPQPTSTPTQPGGTNLSIGAGSDGSSKGSGTSYGDVRDGDMGTYWSPSGTTGRISIKWDADTTVSSVNIREASGAVGAIGSWRLYNHDTGATLASGSGAGMISFSSTTLSKISFEITGASGTPQIAEFETYA
ncbi:carbohydrate-binding protein [Solwaraspora sp. WMMA2065]|uniref:pectate lyase family protein n=1 Tax=Solwaraspora sp. WMMA2065 TaxID=3015166 RepID=UPI00338E79DF